jgi:hypothetical protein
MTPGEQSDDADVRKPGSCRRTPPWLLACKRVLTDAVLTSGEGALTELDETELATLVTLGTR